MAKPTQNLFPSIVGGRGCALKRPDGLSQATAVPIWPGEGAVRQSAQSMGGEAPTWVQIFPYPKYVCTIDGEKTTLVTDDESQRAIVEYFEAKGNALFIDFEHATTTEGVFYAPAAGRIVELVAGGKLGLLARCEWTDEAAEDIRDGRYYYDSPTFWWAQDDKRVYVLAGLALTNHPGSWNRPYITDHNAKNYEALLQKTAAKAATGSTHRGPLQLVCAKGGRSMNLTNFLESLRYTLGRPVTVTGKELRADLQKILEVIPDSEEMIFLKDESQKSTLEATSILEALGDEAVTRLLTPAEQKATAAPVVDLKPIRVALGAEEAADVDALALQILTMKTSTVPVARVRELEQQLAEAKTRTAAERTDLLIANNKARITPATEAEVRRIAGEDFGLAERFVAALPPLDLTTQSVGTTPPAPAPVPAAAATVVDESKTAHERTLEIAQEKGVSYREANELRKKEEAAKK